MRRFTTDLIIGIAALAALFGMLAIYAEQARRSNPSVLTSDTATIIVTARLLNSVGAKPYELTDGTVAHYLVQFGYNDCRNFAYYDEVRRCQDSISKEELNLVRKTMLHGAEFAVATNNHP